MSLTSRKQRMHYISDADVRWDAEGDGRQVQGELSLYKHALSWRELGPACIIMRRAMRGAEKGGRWETR